ncbi:RHS repeat-associated core domain-containing protein, partial [Flavobacterium branchiarum]
KNQQIVGRIIHDPTDPYAQPIGDAVGRWISPDPLGEKMPNYGSYVYAFNNPINFVDPTGMIAEPPTGVDASDGAIHTDSSGSWKYNKATTTWIGQNGAKDLGNTIALNNVNIKGYKKTSYYQGYFDTYKYIDGKNPYSPYTPDGYGLSVSGSVDYNFTTYNMSLNLVLNGNTNKFAGFASTGVGVSSTFGFDWNFGASIDIIDKYNQSGFKGTDSLFDRIEGYSLGGGATYGNWGATHSQSAIYNSKKN